VSHSRSGSGIVVFGFDDKCRDMRMVTKTEQWERNHPDDVPCPKGSDYVARRAARVWHKERGILVEPAVRKRREREAEAVREKGGRADEPQRIPVSVLALLKDPWVTSKMSAFEGTFQPNGSERERIYEPAHYFVHHEHIGANDVTYAEASRLLAENVFGSMAVRDGETIIINEHAKHALDDFCRATAAAWAVYRERLALIERSCPPMPRGSE
jgi:hypothetical protein